VHDPLQDTTNSLRHKAENNEETKGESVSELKFEKYTRVFGPKTSLNDIYIKSNVSDYASQLFKGRKLAWVFYGQSGSGKSYNLMGENNFDYEK